MENRRIIKRRRRRLKKTRILWTIVILLLIVTGFLGVTFFKSYNSAKETYNDLDRTKSELRDKEVTVSSDPFSVLIMGVESYSSGGENGRSDTLMVATFNPDSENMKLVSIPRDSLVEIPELEYKDKITHAYSHGEELLTIQTVENLLDIPIDYYASINFDSFIEIVDELGGVDVNVPFTFSDINSDYDHFTFEKGPMKLGGEAALVYARMRKQDPRGDFGRIERQQQVVKSVLDKLTSPSILLKIDDIAEIIGDNVQTNMKIKEAIALRRKYDSFDTSRLKTLTITGEDLWTDNGYYFHPNEDKMEEIRTILKEHLELIPPQDEESTQTSESDKTEEGSQP